MKPATIVNIDWLSFWGDCCDVIDGHFYKLRETELRTNIFSRTRVIEDISGREVGTIQDKPYSDVLPEHSGILKIDNEILYHEDVIRVVKTLMTDIQFHEISVNRLDIASDFTEIHGENPAKFCRKLISGEYRRVGAAKFFCHGEDVQKLKSIKKYGNGLWVGLADMEFTGGGYLIDVAKIKELSKTQGNAKCYIGSTDVEAVGNGIQFDYIRYGKRNSPVCTYMYNKTKELEEVQDKPWIRRLWLNNGMTAHVWRIEFSFHGNKTQTIDKETGDIFQLDNLGWEQTIERRHDVFRTLANKYFDIRDPQRADGTIEPRTNRMDRVEYLGDETESLIMNRKYSTAKKPAYLDKVLLRKLTEYANEFYIEKPRVAALSRELIKLIAKEKDLMDWGTKKGLPVR